MCNVKTEYKKWRCITNEISFFVSHKNKSLFIFWHVVIFLLLCDHKNISPWHNILRLGVARKVILCRNNKFGVAQKVILFRQKHVDVAQKSISCQQKKVDVVQKSISCQQEQDDAASKKYSVRKKVIIIFQNTAPYHCFNVVVNIKPIYLKKRYLFPNKI